MDELYLYPHFSLEWQSLDFFLQSLHQCHKINKYLLRVDNIYDAVMMLVVWYFNSGFMSRKGIIILFFTIVLCLVE